MNKIFIHIQNNLLQINDYSYKLNEISLLENINIDNTILEIMYNEDIEQSNYIKDINLNLLEIDSKTIKLCKKLIKNQDSYDSTLDKIKNKRGFFVKINNNNVETDIDNLPIIESSSNIHQEQVISTNDINSNIYNDVELAYKKQLLKDISIKINYEKDNRIYLILSPKEKEDTLYRILSIHNDELQSISVDQIEQRIINLEKGSVNSVFNRNGQNISVLNKKELTLEEKIFLLDVKNKQLQIAFIEQKAIEIINNIQLLTIIELENFNEKDDNYWI